MRLCGEQRHLVNAPSFEWCHSCDDDLGRLGRVWREADDETTDWEIVVTDLLAGEYSTPIGVFVFSTFEGWSSDVSAEVAVELRRRCDLQLRKVPASLQDFVDRHGGDRRQLFLPLR